MWGLTYAAGCQPFHQLVGRPGPVDPDQDLTTEPRQDLRQRRLEHRDPTWDSRRRKAARHSLCLLTGGTAERGGGSLRLGRWRTPPRHEAIPPRSDQGDDRGHDQSSDDIDKHSVAERRSSWAGGVLPRHHPRQERKPDRPEHEGDEPHFQSAQSAPHLPHQVSVGFGGPAARAAARPWPTRPPPSAAPDSRRSHPIFSDT
jgi:hypothetical protein